MNLILEDQDDELQLFTASKISNRKVNKGFSQFADE